MECDPRDHRKALVAPEKCRALGLTSPSESEILGGVASYTTSNPSGGVCFACSTLRVPDPMELLGVIYFDSVQAKITLNKENPIGMTDIQGFENLSQLSN